MAQEFSSNETEVEIKQRWLRDFMNGLWDKSVADSQGKATAILWPLLKSQRENVDFLRYRDSSSIPVLSLEVKPQVELNLHSWKDITNRLLVSPSSDIERIGLSFFEEGVGSIHRIKIPLNKAHSEYLKLNYSSTRVIADPETDPDKSHRFPSKPEQGRAMINLDIIELTTGSRRELFRRYKPLDAKKKQEADADLLIQLQATDMAKNPAVNDEWGRLESTPLNIIKIIGSTVFWDRSRGDVGTAQPIYFAGIRVTETLNGKVTVEGLAPWIGHKTWVALPREAQDYVMNNWEPNLPMLEQNLNTLFKAFL